MSILIITIITVICTQKDEYLQNMRYVGVIEINNNEDFFQNFTLCYLMDKNHDKSDYPLRLLYLHKSIDELEKAYNINFEFTLKSNKYYICTYGRKIENMQILFKYDEEDSDYLYDYYYGKIQYSESFSENEIYVYEVNKINVMYEEMTVIDSFGENNEVELVKTDNDSVSLIVFRNGEVNPLFENEFYNKYDVTTEIKVYYYKYETPYLYVINKWGRYTVIDVSSKNIVSRAETLSELPKEYMDKFTEINSFIDISDIDDIPKESSIEFGNGTIYIINVKGINLVKNEKLNNSIFKYPAIIRKAQKYFALGNYLYVIDDEEKCYVINILEYTMLIERYSKSEIPEAYKSVFEDEEIFADIYIP